MRCILYVLKQLLEWIWRFLLMSKTIVNRLSWNNGKRKLSKLNRRRCQILLAKFGQQQLPNIPVAMKVLSNKEERLARKKRKLAAHVQIAQLNDLERSNHNLQSDNKNGDELPREVEVQPKNLKRKHESVSEDDKEQCAEAIAAGKQDDGFTKVNNRKKLRKNKNNVVDENVETDAKLQQTLMITDAQYKELQRQLQQRKKEMKMTPWLFMHMSGELAELKYQEQRRIPINILDIQRLIMSVMLQGKSRHAINWCHVENQKAVKQIVVLVIDGFSLYHYEAYKNVFRKTKNIFEHKMALAMPRDAEGSIIKQLVKIPLNETIERQLIAEFGTLDELMNIENDQIVESINMFPVISNDKHVNDKFPRTELLLTPTQMVNEGYPMRLRGELSNRFAHFVQTKEIYEPVTNQSPMFGIDCEMCTTAAGSNELTRVSVVNEQLETLYESLVLPKTKIIDYLTRFSGITADMMLTATKTLSDVQHDVCELLPADAILVGQSLNSDLNAMQMMHPYIIDTSIIFNLSGVRKRKSKLKVLSKVFLKELIQQKQNGHDSVEDSIATVKLVKLKLSRSLQFGDERLRRKLRYEEIVRTAYKMSNLFANAFVANKPVAIVSTEQGLEQELQTELKYAKEAFVENSAKKLIPTRNVNITEYSSNKHVIEHACQIVPNHAVTLINANVNAQYLLPDDAIETVNKIDKWIDRVWRTVSHNGMFVVLMTGSEECSTGVAGISFKKKPTELAFHASAENEKN